MNDEKIEQTPENCTHDCSSCGASCPSKKEKESFLAPPNAQSHVKRVIGVVSGKGGVGKSLVSCMSAVLMQRRGYQAAVLDADVTGPSVPKILGVTGEILGTEDNNMLPLESASGIRVMSVNLLLEKESMPVVWRGPVVAGVIRQFWSEVEWGDVDYMFVDCPPGTGDVPLTVFQALPLDGIIIVATPQELVSMIVAKALNMAKMMNIPVLGLVENMSYVKCPDCGRELHVFGESHIQEAADEFGLRVLARIPLDPALSALCDEGRLEAMDHAYLDAAADMIAAELPIEN